MSQWVRMGLVFLSDVSGEKKAFTPGSISSEKRESPDYTEKRREWDMGSLQPAFFRPFIDGVIHVFQVNCQLQLTPQKPFIRGSRRQPRFGISSRIGLQSDRFTGHVVICLPEKMYLTAMSHMFGESITEMTPELRDGAAELLNQIFGFAKVVLNEQGETLQPAIPEVISGGQLEQRHDPSATQVVVIPFLCREGEVHIEISAQVSRSSRSRGGRGD
ncbi:MAG: chemotaxis protein CheX [Bdellovibrionia bacterium]